MRTDTVFRATMASYRVLCRLYTSGKGSFIKCRQNVQIFLPRTIGTNVVAARAEDSGKDESEEKAGSTSLYSLQVERQEQAERSALISCPPKTNEKKFLKYLSQHGDIQKHFFYDSYGTYAVVEFSSQDGVRSLLEASVVPCISREAVVPFKSRLLSLRNAGNVKGSDQQPGLSCQPQSPAPISQLIQTLIQQESIDQQLVSLTEAYQLTEDNIRLRFLVCSLLKDVAAAYFPECTVKLFGSSVNGFGKLGCDLDMFLDLDHISGRDVQTQKSALSTEFQMKHATSQRAVTQSILSVIGECVNQFGPGCVGVQKILNARCPLVRFSHQPSSFQCDLTVNNRVALKSTELLHLYAQLDQRVRCLVFTVRCWARTHGLTSSIPGAWITNFSLTVMVLFFLQKRSPPLIPTLNHLQRLAGPDDKCVIEGNDCTFVSNFSKIHLQTNTETLEQLLNDFFEFYSMFPFSKMSINIRKGKEQNKPEMMPLHIQNPFEPTLNVSQNVNASQLDRFVALCQESTWLLQQKRRPLHSGDRSAPQAWGLATLLLPSLGVGIKSHKKRKREPASARITSVLESLKSENQQKTS